MEIPDNYLEKTYAGWLGKIIGIRLGAPIEGRTIRTIINHIYKGQLVFQFTKVVIVKSL